MLKIPKITTKGKKDMVSPQSKGKVQPNGKIGRLEGKTAIKSGRPRNKKLVTAEKLAIRALKLTGLSNEQTAKMAGCSKGTVNNVMKDPDLIDPAVLDRVKKDLAGQSYLLAEAAGRQAMDTISAASAYQAAGIRHYAIEDALNIERGSPPASVNQIQVTVQLTQLQDEIAAMISKATSATPSNASGL